MDPLSITCSAIALAQVCKKIAAGLKILQNLSQVPDEIATLLDELDDLKTVLAAVCTVSNTRESQTFQDHFSSGLRPLLIKASGLLVNIASSCGIELPPGSDSRHSFGCDATADIPNDPQLDLLTRFRWLRDKKRVDRQRERLRTLRLDIANHLATISLVGSFSVLSEVRDLASAFRRLSVDQEDLHRTLATLYKSQVASNKTLIETSYLDVVPDTMEKTETGKISHSSDARLPSAVSDCKTVVTSPPEPDSTTSQVKRPLKISDRYFTCLSSCSCSCHRVTTGKTPAMLQSILGSLTLKLSGVPGFSTGCDEVICRRRSLSSIKISYQLPPKLLNRVLHSVIWFSGTSGPQLSLTSTRIIPQNSDIFCHAMQGNIEGVKSLLTRGLASPYDASHNYAYTALHYAVDYGHLALCEFLLKAGAKAELMDLDERTAIDIAYHKICNPATDDSIRNRLRELFDEDTWLEEKQLTVLHKIILRLIRPPRSLREELQISTKAIDTPDSNGRTPLSWAAERGDVDAVMTLLEYGASHIKKDKEGNGPLHYACKAPAPDVLILLLEIGADPTARNKWSQTPLNYASFFQNNVCFAKYLLQHDGVEIDETDQHGVTAVTNAAFSGHTRMLPYLLDAGADVNQPSDDKTTPLLASISRNNQVSVQTLLRKACECRLNLAYKDVDGETCLHYLARRANVDTIQLFLAEMRDGALDIAGLRTEDVGKDGLSPRDLTKLRGDVEVSKILEEVLVFIEVEIATERSSQSSDCIVYHDTFELLPQWEKDIGFKKPTVRIAELSS